MEELNVNPSFSLYIFLSFLCLTLVNSFSPVDQYLIDCGSTKPTTVDADNRRFIGDSSDLGSRFLLGTRSVPVGDLNSDPNSSPIYHTARVFTRPSKYVFEIREKGTHLVRLHFHLFELSKFKISDAQFHVSVNNRVLLYNYTVENTQNPRVKDYMIWIDTGKIVITFKPLDDSKVAFVNAIEVIPAPNDLIADVAQFVKSDKNVKIKGLLKSALETVHRINVGGPKVTPFNDSLWRTWLPDNEFLKSSDESDTVYFSGRINYQLGGASREIGPDNMYNTARVIKSSDDSIPQLNLTWIFPVKKGYKHLIRLHFCDIASIALGELYFNVYVNGNLAYENLDLTVLTTRLGSPFYADFVVDKVNSGIFKIEVGPSNMSMAHAVDAILNGVEIMKINDPLGNLDGRFLAVSIFKRQPEMKLSVIVPFVAAMSLLITLYMAILRKMVGVKDSTGWSRIPVDAYEVELKSGNRLILNKA